MNVSMTHIVRILLIEREQSELNHELRTNRSNYDQTLRHVKRTSNLFNASKCLNAVKFIIGCISF